MRSFSNMRVSVVNNQLIIRGLRNTRIPFLGDGTALLASTMISGLWIVGIASCLQNVSCHQCVSGEKSGDYICIRGIWEARPQPKTNK